MKKLKYLFLKLISPKGIVSKPSGVNTMKGNSIYNIKVNGIDGNEIDLSLFKGKKLLIVNTASECGYTPQFTELQYLHETHGNKITVLGFPSNNFGGQEPGANSEIGAFCQKNYGVTFQLFEKSDVVGKNQNPVYHWLTHKEQNGWNDEKPNWNFCKYLVNEKGELTKFYTSAVSPLSEELLAQL
ncbi:MAG: glutathione peroxidase [Bacteroidota bacterium]|jgi:glutathione peroxidase|nr:glutathione peroxidase [Bacteroidota bacterium]